MGAALLLAACAWAVTPATWTQSTEADFAAGKLDKTVVTSLGEVMLARDLATVVKPSEELGMISAMAMDGRGRLFVAAAPKAMIYRLENGNLVTVTELPGVLVRSLTASGDQLIAGTCGKEAGIYRIGGKGKVAKLWSDEKVSSVWAVLPAPRGGFYAATGPEGKVFLVDAKGKGAVIYDSDEKNILCLAAGKDGLLYAGTGENGLVVEVDPARRKGRVLYDAAEKEISCLLTDGDGALFAATSDSSKASADGEAPAKEVKGKPDNAAPTKPAGKASEKPAPPKPGPPSGPKITPPVKPNDAPEAIKGPPFRTGVPADDESGAGALLRLAQTGEPKAATSAPAGKVVPVRPAGTSRPAAAPKPMQATPPASPVKVTRPSGPPRRPTPSPARGKGNAVYRIDPDGAVRTIFRRPVTILAMTMHDGVLTLGTGHGGQIFAVDLDDDRTTILAKVDPKDVTAMVPDGKGKLFLGTADKAGIFALGKGYARKGTLISKVLDAKQISRWGTFRVRAEVPGGCKASVAARSGNVAKADDKTWSAWTAEQPAGGWVRITAPPGRYFQYRLTLAGDGSKSPDVDRVRVIYQAHNLRPAISAVRVAASSTVKPRRGAPSKGPMRYRIISIKAADPNGDKLRFKISFRRKGNKLWIKLADKHAAATYAWDTTAAADGTYEVRVEATDAPANAADSALTAARISRALVVDNTPPTVPDLLVNPAGKGGLGLSGKVSDAVSRITRIEYAVDSNDEWLALAAGDGICDSQSETFAATIEDLEGGAHRVAVRVTDEYGNIGHASVEVTVAK